MLSTSWVTELGSDFMAGAMEHFSPLRQWHLKRLFFLQIGCAWRHEKYQIAYRTSWAINYVLGPGAKNQSFCVFPRSSLFGVVLLEPLSLIGAFTTPSTLRDSWQSNNQKVVLPPSLHCYVCRPEDNPEGYNRSSLISRASRIMDNSLLLFHGTRFQWIQA